MNDDRCHIVQGDSALLLPKLRAESIDALVCDPPAGISFMGKEWDHDHGHRNEWIAAFASIFKECLRVLKPGAHGLVWALPRTSHWTATALEDAGFEIRDVGIHLFGTGFPKSKNLDGEWKGWGTALKPAAEHWILVRKPLVGTVAANVIAHGTGGLNIDGCRIETAEGLNGRWPAHVTMDEEAAAMLDAQSGTLTSGVGAVKRKAGQDGAAYGADQRAEGTPMISFGDSGGASRFFYVSKASRKDRGEGNKHPTVKSTALMRWLCRLITPPGGIILDPFMGSGSTGVAALAEGFRFIGIEREAEYFATAQKRLTFKLDEATASR